MRGLYSEETAAALRAEAVAIARGKRGAIEGQSAMPDDASDAAVLAQTVAIHFPHKISSVCADASADTTAAGLLSAVMGEPLGVKLLQTMMFMKAPGSPGQACHQDELYIPTRDASLTAIWVALDRVDHANGCLQVLPGSHKPKVVWPHVACADSRFESVTHIDSEATVGKGEADWVAAEMAAGDALLFSGHLLHRSTENSTEDRYRRAFVSHYCSAESRNPWTNDGRFDVKGESCLRDFTLVAGRDPYAGSMPKQNVLKPFVRDKAFQARLKAEILGGDR